jgi:polar amino acid transport system permease protein
MDFVYILEILPYLLEGVMISIKVFAVTVSLSIPLGIVLASISMINNRIINIIINMYTWIFRGSPLLLQLYFGMYGLPALGITLERMTVALLIFTLNYGAYFTEIVRGSMLSIDQGQAEVSKVLGFSTLQTYCIVIIPQALKRSVQAISNETISLLKDTALIAAIALNDLLRNAKEVVSRDFRVEAFFVAFALYISLSYLVVLCTKKIERKYAYYK